MTNLAKLGVFSIGESEMHLFMDSDLILYVYAPLISFDAVYQIISKLSLDLLDEVVSDYYYEMEGKAKDLQDVLVDCGLMTYSQLILIRDDLFFSNFVEKKGMYGMELLCFSMIEGRNE